MQAALTVIRRARLGLPNPPLSSALITPSLFCEMLDELEPIYAERLPTMGLTAVIRLATSCKCIGLCGKELNVQDMARYISDHLPRSLVLYFSFMVLVLALKQVSLASAPFSSSRNARTFVASSNGDMFVESTVRYGPSAKRKSSHLERISLSTWISVNFPVLLLTRSRWATRWRFSPTSQVS